MHERVLSEVRLPPLERGVMRALDVDHEGEALPLVRPEGHAGRESLGLPVLLGVDLLDGLEHLLTRPARLALDVRRTAESPKKTVIGIVV